MPGIKNTLYNCGYQQISAATLASSTTLTVPAVPGNAESARYAVIQCELGEVRWRDDGTAPTASVGMLLASYPDVLIYDGNLSALRFIRTSATSVLNVSYYY